MKGRLEKITYGMDNLGTALFFHTIGTYIIFFYTDLVRLDPKLVSLAFAISYGVWNAINDPLVGFTLLPHSDTLFGACQGHVPKKGDASTPPF